MYWKTAQASDCIKDGGSSDVEGEADLHTAKSPRAGEERH